MGFEFSSDVDCCVSLLSEIPDSVDVGTLREPLSNGVVRSAYHHYRQGSEVKFTKEDFPVFPGDMSEENMTYDPENGHDTFPIAILIETEDGANIRYFIPPFQVLPFPQAASTRVS